MVALAAAACQGTGDAHAGCRAVAIGGTITLMLAGRRNPRIARVVAINPHDYARGRGMARSLPLGWMITATSNIPLVGETIMRLRNFAIMRAVLQGGVANRESIRAAPLMGDRQCLPGADAVDPYKRIGEPGDVARLATWLCSEEADYITGASLFVDGGMTLCPGFEAGG